MSDRKERFSKLLDVYREGLDRARVTLAEAIAAESNAVETVQALRAAYAESCRLSRDQLQGTANAFDFEFAASWRSTLAQRCISAESARAAASARTTAARRFVTAAHRNVETIEALLRRLAKHEATLAARRVRVEEDAMATLRAASSDARLDSLP